MIDRISSLVSDKVIGKKLKSEMAQIRSFWKSGSFMFSEINSPMLANEGTLTNLTSLMKEFVETLRIALSFSHSNEQTIDEIIDIEREMLESFYDLVTDPYLKFNQRR